MTPGEATARVRAYHERTKHRLDRYAAGPGSLDWDAQPDPFRHWTGSPRLALPRALPDLAVAWDELDADREPAALTLDNLAVLLRLCAALTAWKEYAGSRWALRANPSSGNLHPTETWVMARGVAGMADGLYHYQPRDHSLELRADSPHTPAGEGPGLGGQPGETALWLGFSSIPWREAWKYGERAFRYCQLDMGHLLAAVAAAAAVLGWAPRLQNLEPERLAQVLGLDRDDDYQGVEAEEPECLLALHPAPGAPVPGGWGQWYGRPGLLDPKPLYQWPVIDEVAQASRGVLPPLLPPARPPSPGRGAEGEGTPGRDPASPSATAVILKRRSAQAFDGRSEMPLASFAALIAALLPGGSPAWRLWSLAPRVHPVLMVHRVSGLAPGVYILPRSAHGEGALRQALRQDLAWERAQGMADLPLIHLIRAKCANAARTVSCHQDIAAQCAVAAMFVAEFDGPLGENPAAYRHLHWEAGMLGHQFYLEAEARGWRATGIGCFFDDAMHEILGLTDQRFQVLYHIAVGMPVDDPRLLTRPAYD
ncbi:MAG: SagB family peptide dehydrogenase [Pseudomonadota bacterium]